MKAYSLKEDNVSWEFHFFEGDILQNAPKYM